MIIFKGFWAIIRAYGEQNLIADWIDVIRCYKFVKNAGLPKFKLTPYIYNFSLAGLDQVLSAPPKILNAGTSIYIYIRQFKYFRIPLQITPNIILNHPSCINYIYIRPNLYNKQIFAKYQMPFYVITGTLKGIGVSFLLFNFD